MKITYIGHSGFLIEINECYYLFDWAEGELPKLNPNYQLIVFVSHRHGDHFNKDLLNSIEFENVQFILSSDVVYDAKNMILLNANQKITINEMVIETLKSTDEGVGFYVEAQGYNFYHAGDLNSWKWDEESDEYNNQMESNYRKELEYLKDKKIDVAFLPLDPRQEIYTNLGIEIFTSQVHVDKVFPMHFWNDYTVIDKYNSTHDDKVQKISHKGEIFEISK